MKANEHCVWEGKEAAVMLAYKRRLPYLSRHRANARDRDEGEAGIEVHGRKGECPRPR